MRIHNRLFILSLLVPAFFAVSGCADAEAQEQSSSAVNGGLWSDPSTWPGGAVPQAGDIGRLHLGNGFGFGRGPLESPVLLSRNGRQFEYRGETTIRSGAEVRIDTARESLSPALRLMDDDSWVIFELPGFASTAGGEEQGSMAALRNAGNTSHACLT